MSSFWAVFVFVLGLHVPEFIVCCFEFCGPCLEFELKLEEGGRELEFEEPVASLNDDRMERKLLISTSESTGRHGLW